MLQLKDHTRRDSQAVSSIAQFGLRSVESTPCQGKVSIDCDSSRQALPAIKLN
jgi:hypothetical protein